MLPVLGRPGDESPDVNRHFKHRQSSAHPGGAIGGYSASDSYSEGGSWSTLSKTASTSHTLFGDDQSDSRWTISGSYVESGGATENGTFGSEGKTSLRSGSATLTGGTDYSSDRSYTAQAVYYGGTSRLEAHAHSHDTASFQRRR